MYVLDAGGTIRAHFTESTETLRAEAARILSSLRLASGGARPTSTPSLPRRA